MELDALRSRIDQINQEMLTLFKERMDLSAQIAQAKKESGKAVLDVSRERQILSQITDAAGEDLASYARILFTTLFDLSKTYQNQLLHGQSPLSTEIQKALEEMPKLFPQHAVVACQGVEGAYSQLACDKLFPMADIMYFGHFEGVFQAVEKGLCRYGILPIENSSYGSVREVYDLMRQHKFYIVRSIKLHVAHHLLAKPGVRLEDVTDIYSHEQAIGQCSAFLQAHPNIRVHVCDNTAMAAQMAAEAEGNVAALSSKNCADLYGLTVLAEHVANSDNNYTRFICISRQLEIYPGADRISIMLTTAHEPGALYKVMAKFSALGLNLTKLESRPISGSDFEFMFYLDLDASVYSDAVLALLGELSSSTQQFAFLGAYGEA